MVLRARNAADLAADLERAGIGPSDNLILHSSLKSVGPVTAGPETVVQAILDVIGPGGHLMVPTFTYSLPIWQCDPFDVRNSPGRVGVIPEYVRSRADATRSFHPTHSVAVIGPAAWGITENHLHATPIGRRSPFARMYDRDARVLMLGTNQDTNSSLHLCEVLAGVPYVEVPFTQGQSTEVAWFLNEAGQTEYTQIGEVPGCSRGFRVVEAPLREAGVLKDVRIGDAKSQLLSLRALVPAVIRLLQHDPGMMLCDIPNCAICPKRRLFLERRG